MNKIRFSIEKDYLGGVSDVAYVDDDENPQEALLQQVINDLSTDIKVTVGGVTMPLAAWQEIAGDEDVESFIAATLASAHVS